MKMSEFFRKLSSRKLWLAIAGVSTGIATVLGVDGSEIAIVCGSVTVLISAVTYIITEGKIDAERVKQLIESTQTSIDTIKGVDDGGNKC